MTSTLLRWRTAASETDVLSISHDLKDITNFPVDQTRIIIYKQAAMMRGTQKRLLKGERDPPGKDKTVPNYKLPSLKMLCKQYEIQIECR